MSSQDMFKNVNVADLFSSSTTQATGDSWADGEIVWSDAQRKEMDMRLAKARMQYRKTQMRVQRGGQARYELRKQRLEMKNNHVSQSADGVKPNDRQDPAQIVNVGQEWVNLRSNPESTKNTTVSSAVSSGVSSKAKRNRANRAARKKKQREAKQKQEESESEKSPPIIEVPGTGTDYEKIRLHLTDESHDARSQSEKNDDASDLSEVLGGASETAEASETV